MYKVVITGTMLALSLNGVAQQDKKSEKARKNVVEANKDLREAKRDSVADFKKFKQEAELSIKENQKKIAELKLHKMNENIESKEKYDKKVLALEQKNNELKNKIEGCETIKTSMWSSFKSEFNHDMNELGHAIRDIGVDNKK